MIDDAPFYCARCLARITDDRLDECECRVCGAVIGSEDDYLDAEQLEQHRQREAAEWERARRDGLIA